MSTASSSSQRIPQLPAAFLAPQECSSTLCRFPDTPLPPPSPIILAVLKKSFLAHYRRAFDCLCSRLHKGSNGATLYIKWRIEQLARDGLSPEEIIRRINSAETRREVDEMLRNGFHLEKIEEAISDMNRSATNDAVLSFRIAVEVTVYRMIRERSHSSTVGFSSTPLCLHDYLDPINEDSWTAYLDVDEKIPGSAYPEEEDLLSLKISLEYAIYEGKVRGAGWGTPLVWSLQLKAMQEGYLRLLGEEGSAIINRGECVESVRIALDEMGSAVPFLAHSLSLSHKTADLTLHNALASSSVLNDFATLTYFRYTQGRSAADATTPPEIAASFPARIPVLFPSSAAGSTTTSSFRRTRAVPNDSKLFGAILRRVQPRICAPDRCSGRTPPSISDDSAPDYARVEMAILKLFEYWFRFAFSRLLLADGNELAVVCTRALHSTKSLATKEATERFEMIRVIEESLRELHTEQHFWNIAASAVLRLAFCQTHEQLVSLKVDPSAPRRFPCLCDLVNNVDKLERSVRKNPSLVKVEPQKVQESASSIIKIICASILRDWEAGQLGGECWRGSSWGTEFVSLVIFTEENVRAWMETVDYQEGFFARCLDLFTVTGSARILEECVEAAAGKPQESGYSFSVGHVIDLASDGEFSVAARHNKYREAADEQFQEDNFLDAIRAYKVCFSLSTAASWSARINSAAARLRLADSGDHQQYSLAIQDCTMALYYDCPLAARFKAYYRRGLALARLSLFEKAILDFEQALLIEPENVLIKQELAAAKNSLSPSSRR